MSPDPKSPETIFGEAIAIESPEDRAAFLDQACQDNPELRRELEKLVRALAAGAAMPERFLGWRKEVITDQLVAVAHT